MADAVGTAGPMIRELRVASALFLLVLMAYFLCSTGRIDIIDSQIRYEGTRGVLQTGFPLISPNYRGGTGVMNTSLGPDVYASSYGVSPHLVYAPFLAFLQQFERGMDFEQFWFSHINQLFAAATMLILFLFYRAMGFTLRDSVLWTLLCAFFTQFFATATSTFYQPLQGFFLVGSLFCAFRAGQLRSLLWTAGSGLMLFGLINLKPAYGVFIPFVALLLLSREQEKITIDRQCWQRILLLLVLVGRSFGFWEFYRSFYAVSGRGEGEMMGQTVKALSGLKNKGSFLMGLGILLVSPGKGMIFFSPILLVALFGVRQMFSLHKWLAVSALAVSAIWIVGIARTPFPGGDWCWGPRYLVPIIPLLFLLVPFGYRKLFAARPGMGKLLLGYCLVIQLLGISMDSHQYFFRNGLQAFFWKDQSYYFSHSQLVERPIDIMEGIRHAPELDMSGPFRPGPFPDSLTFAVFGAYHPDRNLMILWAKQYPVFWLPGPWPLWMPFLSPERLPVSWGVTLLVSLALLVGAIFSLRSALKNTHGEIDRLDILGKGA